MRNKLRIARIITRLNVGGPAQNVRILHEKLDTARFDSQLLSGRVGAEEVEVPWADSLVSLRVEGLRRPFSIPDDLAAVKHVKSFLQKFQPHVVHSHTGKAGLVGRLASIRADIGKRVHTYHGHTFHSYWNRMTHRLLLSVERWLARRTDVLIAQSESQASEIGRYLGAAAKGKIRVIEPTIDFEGLAQSRGEIESLRSELGLEGHALLLFVGRLAPVKDPGAFLRIVARVKAQSTQPVAALVCGVGGEAMEGTLLSECNSLGLSDSIRWLGVREDMGRIYGLADVLILTSRNEGTPLSLIEALASGTRMVAYDVGGVADTLGAAGGTELVSVGDEEKAAMSVLRALEKGRPAVDEMADRALDTHCRFETFRMLEEMTSVYEELSSPRAEVMNDLI